MRVDPYPNTSFEGARYRECRIHGPLIKQVELRITSGSVEPTVGETVTGATSGDTGVVTSVHLESGAWSGTTNYNITNEDLQPLDCENGDNLVVETSSATGGDAVATVYMNNHTGVDSDTGEWGSTTETLNGSTAGTNFGTRYVAPEQVYGRLFAEQEMVNVDGEWFCMDCYRRRYPKKYLDEYQITDDDDSVRNDTH